MVAKDEDGERERREREKIVPELRALGLRGLDLVRSLRQRRVRRLPVCHRRARLSLGSICLDDRDLRQLQGVGQAACQPNLLFAQFFNFRRLRFVHFPLVHEGPLRVAQLVHGLGLAVLLGLGQLALGCFGLAIGRV